MARDTSVNLRNTVGKDFRVGEVVPFVRHGNQGSPRGLGDL